jgi:hypothetical protein
LIVNRWLRRLPLNTADGFGYQKAVTQNKQLQINRNKTSSITAEGKGLYMQVLKSQALVAI